ncbi:MAG: hypothetical protein AAFQ23_00455 [Cyanobacteria bacterium J06623_1]
MVFSEINRIAKDDRQSINPQAKMKPRRERRSELKSNLKNSEKKMA